MRGNNIPIWAQVVSLADVYDAIDQRARVQGRVYADAQAVSMILNGECGVFNPRLLNSFLSVASRLENGEIGPMFRERAAAPAKPSHKKHSTFGPDLVAAQSVNAKNTASFPSFRGISSSITT